jgi:outer membrane biogenesis lipoprotein LolB
MKKNSLKTIFTALMGIALLASCKKSADVTPVPTVQAQLTDKIWRMEKVTEVRSGAAANIIYQRGATNNQEDFSLVRQQFKANGTLAYTDETGASGTNSHWELLDNNTRLKITFGGFGVTFEQFTISAAQFSYKSPFATATDYVLYTFTPVP